MTGCVGEETSHKGKNCKFHHSEFFSNLRKVNRRTVTKKRFVKWYETYDLGDEMKCILNDELLHKICKTKMNHRGDVK